MKYYHLSTGLRGCYMPDSAHVLKVSSRRELKSYIEDEARNWRDGGAQGLSKKAVASFVAEAWRKPPPSLPLCLPIKPEGAQDYSSGIFISAATRQEYVDYMEEMED